MIEEAKRQLDTVDAVEEKEAPAENRQDEQTAEQVQQQIKQQSELRRKLVRAEGGMKEYQYFLIRLAVLLLLVWILFFKIVGLTHMPNGDMYPRVDLGDLVLFYRLDTDVRAQDVIVIDKMTPDTQERRIFICRVVAVEGDTVEITDDGALKINGNTMIESNIFSRMTPYEGYTEYPLTLGEGQCFVLADHRDGGADSRYFGAVEKDEIAGTVITIIRRNAL